MSDFSVKIKLFPGGIAPRRMSAGSAGYDIFARLDSDIVLQPGERTAIPAGFALQIPDGYEAQIRPRSGLALKKGLMMLNSPGTIDPDYRGEIKIILANFGKEEVVIRNGDRIAQMIFSPVAHTEFKIVSELSKSERGEGGFGSTGVR